MRLLNRLPVIKIITLCLLLLLFAITLLSAHDNAFGFSWAVPDVLPTDRMTSEVRNFSTHLPILVMQTNVEHLRNRQTPPRAVIRFYDNGTENRLTDTPTEMYSFATASFRGNSSFRSANPGYSLKFHDEHFRTTSNVSFFGLEPADEWVLRTTYQDTSMLRDWFSYELAATVLDWQPRGGMVQVFRQDRQQGMIEYLGIFYLCQYIPAATQTGLNLGAFNLSDSDGIDVEGGGYLIQRNPSRDNHFAESGFRIMYPAENDITAHQENLLRSEIIFYDSLLGKDRTAHTVDDDCDCWEYIDIDSFADVFLVGEIVKMADRGVASVFMYRRASDTKLTVGPVWDCDGTMGIAHNRMQARWYNFLKQEDDLFLNFLGCSAFTDALSEKYSEYRKNIWSDENILQLFDSMALHLQEPAAQHTERWPHLSRNDLEWKDEVEWMRSWLIQRLAWLDEHIPELKYKTPNEINNEFQSTLESLD